MEGHNIFPCAYSVTIEWSCLIYSITMLSHILDFQGYILFSSQCITLHVAAAAVSLPFHVCVSLCVVPVWVTHACGSPRLMSNVLSSILFSSLLLYLYPLLLSPFSLLSSVPPTTKKILSILNILASILFNFPSLQLKTDQLVVGISWSISVTAQVVDVSLFPHPRCLTSGLDVHCETVHIEWDSSAMVLTAPAFP